MNRLNHVLPSAQSRDMHSEVGTSRKWLSYHIVLSRALPRPALLSCCRAFLLSSTPLSFSPPPKYFGVPFGNS